MVDYRILDFFELLLAITNHNFIMDSNKKPLLENADPELCSTVCSGSEFDKNIKRFLSFPLFDQAFLSYNDRIVPSGLLCFYCLQLKHDIYCCGLYKFKLPFYDTRTELCALGKFSVGDWDQIATFLQKTLDNYYPVRKNNNWFIRFCGDVDVSQFWCKGGEDVVDSELKYSDDSNSPDLAFLDKTLMDSKASEFIRVVSSLVTNKDECLFQPINMLRKEAAAYNQDRTKPVGGYLKSFARCLLNLTEFEEKREKKLDEEAGSCSIF